MKEKTKSFKMVEPAASEIEILPLKDFVIKQNDFFIELKQGTPATVPVRFIQNLKTEKIIRE